VSIAYVGKSRPEWGTLRIVESVAAIVACLVAIGLGFYLARLWAPTSVWALLIGVVSGGICAAVYFVATVLAGELIPDFLAAEKVGFWFMILLAAAPSCGALGGFIGQRRTPGLGPF
jgi:MFS family permease